MTKRKKKYKFPSDDLEDYFLGSDPKKHKDYNWFKGAK